MAGRLNRGEKFDPGNVALFYEHTPYLVKLYHTNPKEFAKLMKPILVLLERSLEKGYPDVSEEYFERNLGQVISDIVDAFFDMEGILSKHGQEYVKELAKTHKHAVHPLHAALTGSTSSSGLMGTKDDVTFEQKFGAPRDRFNIKDWIHKLLFFSYYTDLGELAYALSVSNISKLDPTIRAHMRRLVPIQPLKLYQEKHKIPVGEMIRGTGLFQTKIPASKVKKDICPVCHKADTIYETDLVKACKYCQAGFEK